MKEALLRFTVVSFSGKLIFNGVQGHFSASIKIDIFKTLLGVSPGFLHMNTRIENIVCVRRGYKKEGFLTTHCRSWMWCENILNKVLH